MKKELKRVSDFIVKEKKKIIFSLIGLVITICAIFLYIKFDLYWLKWVLSLSCMIYTVLELYYIHFLNKDYKVSDNMLFSTVTMIGVVLLMYVIICVFSALLKIDISMKTLTIAVLISPSFVIVLLIILLLISSLQYI